MYTILRALLGKLHGRHQTGDRDLNVLVAAARAQGEESLLDGSADLLLEIVDVVQNDGDGSDQLPGEGHLRKLGQRNDVVDAHLVGREEGGQHKLDSVGVRTVMMASRAAWAES